MNIDATHADLAAAAEVLKLAAILDDRAPKADKARIAAWGEKIHAHKLERGDLIDGLQLYYDSPQDRPIGIGDLIHFGRQCKRYRTEQEADAEREARQDANRVKAADEQRAFAAAVVMGPTPKRNRTPRLEAAEVALQCCHGKTESLAALREYFTAKQEARKPTKGGRR